MPRRARRAPRRARRKSVDGAWTPRRRLGDALRTEITIKQILSLHSLAPVSDHQEKHHMLFHNPKDKKIKNMKNDLAQKLIISTNLQ